MTKNHNSYQSGGNTYNASNYWNNHKSANNNSGSKSNSSKRARSGKSRKSSSSSSSSSSRRSKTRKSTVIKQKLKSFKYLQKSIKMPSASACNIRANRKSVVDDGTNDPGSYSSTIDQPNQSNQQQQQSQLSSYDNGSGGGGFVPGQQAQPPQQPLKQCINKFATLESKLSKSFRGLATNSVKLKLDATGFKDGDTGSLFVQKMENQDSALHLLAATIKEDDELRQEETEIFIPGKGDLRCSFS